MLDNWVKFQFSIRDHSSITSAKRWVGGVAKCWCFLMRWVGGGGQMLTWAKNKKKIPKEKKIICLRKNKVKVSSRIHPKKRTFCGQKCALEFTKKCPREFTFWKCPRKFAHFEKNCPREVNVHKCLHPIFDIYLIIYFRLFF